MVRRRPALVPRFRVAHLRLKPGDVVVTRFDRLLPSAALEHIARTLRRAFPEDVRLLIIEPGTELSVISVPDGPQAPVDMRTFLRLP